MEYDQGWTLQYTASIPMKFSFYYTESFGELERSKLYLVIHITSVIYLYEIIE